MNIGIFTIFSKRSGGNVYKQHVVNALSEDFNVEYINLEAKYFKNRYLKGLESLAKLFSFTGEKNLWIHDFYSVLTMSKKRMPGKHLALIFHVDFSGFRAVPRMLLPLLEKSFFYRQLKKVDVIVVISEFWKNYFLERGYKNVYKIYCGFDLNHFNIKDTEVAEFKGKYNLTDKPIIYLGNCQRPKGVVESYQALRALDVHFVTSGRKEVKVPTINLDVDYKTYLTLLKASSVVVTMSLFKEGWCMTAHEAMLLKTPIIGSGRGGMRELLEGGGQIICRDFSSLKREVESLLSDQEQRRFLGEKGYQFSKNFTMERFNNEWIALMRSM